MPPSRGSPAGAKATASEPNGNCVEVATVPGSRASGQQASARRARCCRSPSIAGLRSCTRSRTAPSTAERSHGEHPSGAVSRVGVFVSVEFSAEVGEQVSWGSSSACAEPTRSTASGSSRSRNHPRLRGADGIADQVGAGVERNHPRVRGTDRANPQDGVRAPEPSPRARADPLASEAVCRRRKPSPACAGPTGCRRSCRPRRGKPSRVRGPTGTRCATWQAMEEPSPRARGRQRFRCFRNPPRGTIPRARGRTVPRTIPACAGRLPDVRVCRRTPGTIPACAGPTSPTTTTNPLPGNHPRVRGPTARRGRSHLLHGTIPACAGPTRAHALRRVQAGNHPRVRGADTSTACPPGSGGEPSPRARGRLQVPDRAHGALRTIPACAGRLAVGPQAHRAPGEPSPRARGRLSKTHRGLAPWGTIPRARGRRPDRIRRVHVDGTIPACAGPTPPRR